MGRRESKRSAGRHPRGRDRTQLPAEGPPSTSRWQRGARVVVTLVLLLTIVAGVFLRYQNLTNNGIRGNDTVYYTSLAQAWSEGEFPVRIADGIVAYRPVVYAVYGAGIRLLGFHDWTLKIVNATLDSLNIGLVFLLCFWLGRRDVWLSLIAGASYALLPAAIVLAREELVHVTSTFMLLSSGLLLVLATRNALGGRRSLLASLSGLFCAFAVLTHEELVFCAPGFVLVVIWDGLARRGAEGRWRGFRDGVLFGIPVLGAAALIYFANQGPIANLLGAGVDRSILERVASYLARLFRFSWNGVVATSSILTAYACLGLALACLSGLIRGGRWRKVSLARPIDALPWAVVGGYLAAYALFFPTVLFGRTFMPMAALLVVGLAVGWGQILVQRYTRTRAHGIVLALAIAAVPFNMHQFTTFFVEGGKQWYAEPFPSEFNPGAGVARLGRWVQSSQLSRRIHDALAPHVSSDARLLIASSLMTPDPGRRVFQLDYYFGDDAIYIIDHEEPIDELIEKYQIKFVMVSTFRQDSRVANLEQYRAYRYEGEWSEVRPLRLGASYGFTVGEYTPAREASFVEEYMLGRGAILLTSGATTRIYGL